MPDDSDRHLATARAWIDSMPGGEAFLQSLGKLLDALKREDQANSDDARADAQRDAMAAEKTISEILGITALRQRLLLTALDDLPLGARVDERAYRQRIGEAVSDASRAGRSRLCYTMARAVLDYRGIMGGPLADHLAGTFTQLAEGRFSMLEYDRRQGLDPETGAALLHRHGVISATGYEAGVRYGLDRIADVLWKEAASDYNTHAQALRRSGEKCPAVSAKTVRDWCIRKRNKKGGENKDRKTFESMRRQGTRAAALGLVEPNSRLAAVGKIIRE